MANIVSFKEYIAEDRTQRLNIGQAFTKLKNMMGNLNNLNTYLTANAESLKVIGNPMIRTDFARSGLQLLEWAFMKAGGTLTDKDPTKLDAEYSQAINSVTSDYQAINSTVLPIYAFYGQEKIAAQILDKWFKQGTIKASEINTTTGMIQKLKAVKDVPIKLAPYLRKVPVYLNEDFYTKVNKSIEKILTAPDTIKPMLSEEEKKWLQEIIDDGGAKFAAAHIDPKKMYNNAVHSDVVAGFRGSFR